MGQGSNVDDFDDFDAGAMDGTDCGLTAVTRTLHEGLHLAQAKIIGGLGAVLSCHLSGIGSVLLRTTETHLACAGPGNHLSLAVGKRNDDVVEGTVHMELAQRVNLHVSFLCCNCFLCHIFI